MKRKIKGTLDFMFNSLQRNAASSVKFKVLWRQSGPDWGRFTALVTVATGS